METEPDEIKTQFSPYGTRALAAYFRSGGADQPSNTIMQHTIRGKDYVVLENVNGILAVYRVKPDGYLKGLRRWPSILDEIVTGGEGL